MSRRCHPFEILYGRNGPGLMEVLLGVGRPSSRSPTQPSARATAERLVKIGSDHTVPPDQLGSAHFLLARVRWAQGEDRPGAVAMAREARARLTALPYPADALPRIDRWLAQVAR